jgi:hypothetical protein
MRVPQRTLMPAYYGGSIKNARRYGATPPTLLGIFIENYINLISDILSVSIFL